MNGILDAAVEVDLKLQRLGVSYCLIGGIATQRWGEPRTTLDVDVTVMSSYGNEATVIAQIVPLFEPRIADAAEFAEQSRVLLLQTGSGVGIDVSLGALPFESRMIDRSTIWRLDERRSLRTCAAEDLIVQKAFAGRGQDWLDIEKIIQRQSPAKLEIQTILVELEPLLELKEDQQSLRRVQQLLGKGQNASDP